MFGFNHWVYLENSNLFVLRGDQRQIIVTLAFAFS